MFQPCLIKLYQFVDIFTAIFRNRLRLKHIEIHLFILVKHAQENAIY